MGNRCLNPKDGAYPGPPLWTKFFIRILELQPGIGDAPIVCQLVAYSLDHLPHYDALFYVWGDHTVRRNIYVRCPGSTCRHEYSVTSNCFAALRRLRSNGSGEGNFALSLPRPRPLIRNFWIDAICIDQSNLAERSQQVTLMADIYFLAQQVVIYVGDRSEDSDFAMDHMTSGNPQMGDSRVDSAAKSLNQALASFFQRPSFSRVWVIQEVYFARNAVVMCGERYKWWQGVHSFLARSWMGKVPPVAKVWKNGLLETMESSRAEGQYIIQLLACARGSQATDPRDKIYGLLSLFRSCIFTYPAPCYGDSIVKVYTDWAAHLVGLCGYDVLLEVKGPARLSALPSWVPDWTAPASRGVLPIDFKRNTGTHNSDGSDEHALRVLPTDRTSPNFQAISKPALQAFGYSCGAVSRLGSTYWAPKNPFPLNEWRDLMMEEFNLKELRPLESAHLFFRRSKSIDLYLPFLSATYRKELYELEDFFKWRSVPPNELGFSVQFTESPLSPMHNPSTESSSTHPAHINSVPFEEIPFEKIVQGALLLDENAREKVLQIYVVCHARRFFITDSGFVGLGPAELQLGDVIYDCVGAPMHFAFRKTTQQPDKENVTLVELVGECGVRHRDGDEPWWSNSMPAELECLHIV